MPLWLQRNYKFFLAFVLSAAALNTAVLAAVVYRIAVTVFGYNPK